MPRPKDKTRLEHLPDNYCGDDFKEAKREVIQTYPVLEENQTLIQKYPNIIEAVMILHQTYRIRKVRDQVDEDFQLLPSYGIGTVNDFIFLLINENERGIQAYEYIITTDKNKPSRSKISYSSKKDKSNKKIPRFSPENLEKFLERIKRSK